MTRIKQKFENLKYKFSNLDVRKKRLLITTGVLAVMLPIVAVSIFAASNPNVQTLDVYCDNETGEIVPGYKWVVEGNIGSRYLDKNHDRCNKCKTVSTREAELATAERAYQNIKKEVDGLNQNVAATKKAYDTAYAKWDNLKTKMNNATSLSEKMELQKAANTASADAVTARTKWEEAKTLLENAKAELTHKANALTTARNKLNEAKSACETYRNNLNSSHSGTVVDSTLPPVCDTQTGKVVKIAHSTLNNDSEYRYATVYYSPDGTSCSAWPPYCDKVLKQISRPSNDAIIAQPERYAPISDPACDKNASTTGGNNSPSSSGSTSGAPAQSNEIASSAALNFILANGQMSNATNITSGTDWGNLVLTFTQGHQNAGQPVTATITLPQGVTLAPEQPIQYDLSTNPNNYQVLPNGETIITTGVQTPVGLGAGQFIHLNIRVTANVNCGSKDRFSINANIKDAAGNVINAQQPVTLVVDGQACPETPTTPEQPNQSPEAAQANFAVDLAVSPHQQNNFVDNLSVKPEQVVDFRIGYANYGQTPNQDVKVSYTLPSGFTFIPGTIRLNNNKVQIGDNAMNNGKLETSIGDYNPQDGAHLTFSAVAEKLDCGEQKNDIASVVRISTQGLSKSDTTSLSIKADACGTNNEQNIQVCELDTKKVILIPESTFNESTHSKDISKCQAETITPSTDNNIRVCELATKKRTTIKESAFDSNLHSRDLSQCPLAELPNTGTSDTIMAVVILSIVTAITGYAINSRKAKRANSDKDSL